jgi:hypothetical protein
MALGFTARSGKGEVASYLARAYSASNILVTSFAKALRREIHDEVQQIAADYLCPPREAMEILCYRKGVEYDPFAKPDNLNPYGKQRRLQQWWGTDYRRSECPTWWLDKVAAEIVASGADLVILDDARFPNELGWVKSNGGVTVKVIRPGHSELSTQAASHISESALADYPFDYTILNDGSLSQLYQRANKVFHQVTQGKLPF